MTIEDFQELVALAEQRHCTVGELIVALVREQGAAPSPLPPFVGLFANEPELMGQVMEDVYHTRETQWLSDGDDFQRHGRREDFAREPGRSGDE